MKNLNIIFGLGLLLITSAARAQDPNLVRSFVESVRPALYTSESAGETINPVQSPESEVKLVEAVLSYYLSKHPELDPNTCSLSLGEKKTQTYQGTKDQNIAWAEGIVHGLEKKLSEDPSKGVIGIGLVLHATGTKGSNQEETRNLEDWDDFIRQLKVDAQVTRDSGYNVEGLSISNQVLAAFGVSQKEFKKFAIDELGVPADKIFFSDTQQSASEFLTSKSTSPVVTSKMQYYEVNFNCSKKVEEKKPVEQKPVPAPKSQVIDPEAPKAKNNSPFITKTTTVPVKPAPVQQKPAPMQQKPAPVIPAPVVPKPVPVVQKPTTVTPAPVVQKTAPVTQAPVVQKKSPVPTSTSKTPASSSKPKSKSNEKAPKHKKSKRYKMPGMNKYQWSCPRVS